MPKYSDKIYNECKYLFVVKSKTIRQVAELKEPCFATIGNWARKKDPENDNQTWFDLQKQQRKLNYENLAPNQRIVKMYEELDRLMQEDQIDADAIAKLTASINRIAKPEYQVPVMYYMLEELLLYFKDNAPEFLTDQFKKLITNFKDHLLIKLIG